MSDGDSIKHSSYTSSPLSDHANGEMGPLHEQNEGDDQLQFDLSDPNDLEMKVHNLSEQEMDELLAQAYKVNQELKKELHRQEGADSNKSPSGRTKSKSSLGAKAKKSESSAQLPPLRHTSGSKSSGPRGFTSLNYKSSAHHYTASPVNPSRHKAATAVKHPSAKLKPEWDDRFSL